MKTRMVEERIGEYLGPIDWSFDFESHDWNHGGCTNPECVKSGVEFLKQMGDGKGLEILYHGNWHEVLWVGMYDGWPYWKPYPTVCYRTWLGAEHGSPWSISQIRRKGGQHEP